MSLNSRLKQVSEKLNLLQPIWQQERNLRTSYIEEDEVFVHQPVPSSQLDDIESRHGINFPEAYRAFLEQIGDIVVGPGLGMEPLEKSIYQHSSESFPLDRPFLGELSIEHQSLPESEKRESYLSLGKQWDKIPKEHGVLLIADYGCAIYAMLVLNGPMIGQIWMQQGEVSYYGPYGGYEGFDDERYTFEGITNTPSEYYFLEWYEFWLDVQIREWVDLEE
ncbi:Hypothetical protein PBC10988_26370 [Planctomycetales bacterium 10988]|nr:Hypothetical protein PBC10988_26370 [Planctomycetales bacterium 10988]